MLYNLPEAEQHLREKPDAEREEREKVGGGARRGDGASLIAQLVKNSPATQETLV